MYEENSGMCECAWRNATAEQYGDLFYTIVLHLLKLLPLTLHRFPCESEYEKHFTYVYRLLEYAWQDCHTLFIHTEHT